MKQTNKIITLSIFCASSLFGVTPPTSGDMQRLAQPQQMQEIQKELPTIKKEYKAPLKIKDDTTTLVKGFIFSGNSVFSSEELSSLTKEFENTQMGINALKNVASIITKFYRDNGYFVARAYLPAQTLKDGIVEIAIIEGAYGGFKIKNSSLVNESEPQGYMDYLSDGHVVSTPSLERQMLLINELSGVVVTQAEVYPGAEVGESDFGVTTAATSKYSGYAIADNYGSRYTGEHRLSLGGYINSFSGVGDTLAITGLISETANLANLGFNYERALGYSGLKGSINASAIKYKLDEIPNYEAEGTLNSIGAGLSYPTIKTRSHTQLLSLNYAYRDFEDTAGAQGAAQTSLKHIHNATAAFSDRSNTNILGMPGKLFISLSATAGNLSLDNEEARVLDELLESEGTYAKVNATLFHTHQFHPKLSLQTTLKGQQSLGKNLDSSEDITVGGSNGVRAYEDSELSGDKGYTGSLELIYALPKLQEYNHYASIFVDSAKVWRNDTIFNTEENEREINAYGIGYTLAYKAFDLKATYARGFGNDATPRSEAEFSTDKNKFLFQGMVRF